MAIELEESWRNAWYLD